MSRKALVHKILPLTSSLLRAKKISFKIFIYVINICLSNYLFNLSSQKKPRKNTALYNKNKFSPLSKKICSSGTSVLIMHKDNYDFTLV